MKLCITSGLLAGGLVGASALAQNDLGSSTTRENSTRSVFKNASTPTNFGGVAGAECVYDNYLPLDDFGAPASQKDSVYPFFAEAADDFTLSGGSGNDCLLSDVVFAVSWFNNPAGVSPFACWNGVNITIYEDAADFCGAGFLKGPAGEPLDALPQGHVEYCPGSVVCEIKTSMDNIFAANLLASDCTGSIQYEIQVSGLQDAECKLEKNHKYWIAIAPAQSFGDCGQTAIMLSANDPVGHGAQQIFTLLGLPWTSIGGNADGCPPDTPPAGSHQDLSIAIFGEKNGGAAASLDIKPGSCPNSFNRNSNGVLPVALVGTDSFDVKDVDLSSVAISRADGVGGSVAPHEGPPGPHSEFEDVATPFDGEECDCHELEGDGITDLSMKFKTSDVVAALELNDLSPGDLVQLVLNGVLLDGTPFSASDCIRLVPPGTAPGMVGVGSNLPGAWIDVGPLDLQLDGGGFGHFGRTYPLTTIVTLTAPAEQLGWKFIGWEYNSSGLSSITGTLLGGGGLLRDPTIEIIIIGDEFSMKAIYVPN